MKREEGRRKEVETIGEGQVKEKIVETEKKVDRR